MALTIDFISDWIAVLKTALAQMGYTVPAQADPQRIPLLYLNALKRRIPSRARTVLTAKEFVCPGLLQAGLASLEAKVRNGGDLKPHRSRLLAKLSFDDALLNDWNVYHFHLGTALEADGFIQRTGPVLFALVTANEFYEINIFPHQQWSNIDVVDILHNNWPNIIEGHRWKDAKSLTFNPNSGDVAALRKANVNTSIQTKDGTIYGPIGGGYSTDGTSFDVVMLNNKLRKKIIALERQMQKEAGRFVEELKNRGYRDGDVLSATFQQNCGRWCAKFQGFDYIVDFGEMKLT